MPTPFTWPGLDQWLLDALKEDVGAGDVTTDAVVDAGAMARMEWVAKSELVACGLFAGARVFELLNPAVRLKMVVAEGRAVKPGLVMLRITGPARPLLTGERTALNIAQRLSGIATLTRQYVHAVAGTSAKIAATRKTTPLMRRLEKYAVTVGGGTPHRFGLDDGVLIKDNHIALAGSIATAVARAHKVHHLLRIEVEVASLGEAEQAVKAGADVLLLDNMSVAEMRPVVKKFGGRVVLEASGNMTIERAAQAARAGVDIISVGALTHSAPAADISARMYPARPRKR
ncbi:MAG TPA: carboxylating nicotinate-nucleotide diphosphorylase [bacterium]|nr:carboxylating nicotinate-nucleotide diphosphorylase [bacterium]